jgi:hypothetical protein
MKKKQITRYVCEICGTEYSDAEKAKKCESRSVQYERGVKIGDVVRITAGEGQGKFLKVTSVGIANMDWGHYQWERYWHTVYVSGDVINYWGSRLLTFDSYEVV